MTGKHYKWQTQWQRLPDGRLQHDTGLIVEHDEDLGWMTDDASLEAFQAAEVARGVPLHDLHARLQRLLREAAQWLDGRATDAKNPPPARRPEGELVSAADEFSAQPADPGTSPALPGGDVSDRPARGRLPGSSAASDSLRW